MSDPAVIDLASASDVARAGGKAINLCELIAAGFPVPDGFVVTTAAYADAHGAKEMPAELAEEITRAYRKMGAPTVAVRSSATAEDMAGASMAGQYETFLNVCGETELLKAVADCWRSLDSPRTRSYLA